MIVHQGYTDSDMLNIPTLRVKFNAEKCEKNSSYLYLGNI